MDKRGGAFADDLYAVISDNRFGTAASSNTDIFLFKSIDGGTSWIGPTRVNDDRSVAPPDRDCGRVDGNLPTLAGVTAQCQAGANYGNDQWFPWVDISDDGDVNVVFHDRRLDTDSTASEWPGSRQRAGNYLAWFWGGVCRVDKADSRDCVAPTAGNSGLANQDCQDQATPNLHCQDPGRTPAAGFNQTVFPFRNYTVSDSPYNLDYAFRAGIFMGDYENIDIVGSDAAASGPTPGTAARPVTRRHRTTSSAATRRASSPTPSSTGSRRRTERAVRTRRARRTMRSPSPRARVDIKDKGITRRGSSPLRSERGPRRRGPRRVYGYGYSYGSSGGGQSGIGSLATAIRPEASWAVIATSPPQRCSVVAARRAVNPPILRSERCAGRVWRRPGSS